MQPLNQSEINHNDLKLWSCEDADAWLEAKSAPESETWIEENPLLETDSWNDLDDNEPISRPSLVRFGIR